MNKLSPPSRKRGRPLTGQMPKRYFRMTDCEYALVCQAAKKKATNTDERKNVSEFIRGTILAKAKSILNQKSGGRGS